MSSSHNCIRSSINICQSFSDWFLQHPALGLTEALRSSKKELGIQDKVFSHCSVLSGDGMGYNSFAWCEFWTNWELRWKAGQLESKCHSGCADIGACSWLMLKARMGGCSCWCSAGSVGALQRGPFSFLVGREQAQMYAPCKQPGSYEEQKRAWVYLPISSLKLTHKYVAPCTNEEGERGRGVEVVKLPLLEKKHEEENRVRSPVGGGRWAQERQGDPKTSNAWLLFIPIECERESLTFLIPPIHLTE